MFLNKFDQIKKEIELGNSFLVNLTAKTKIKSNYTIAEIYNKEGSFPLTLLLDANGKILKSWHGKPEMTPDEWTAEIKAICDSKK